MRKRGAVCFTIKSSWCDVTVSVLWLFLAVPWVGLQYSGISSSYSLFLHNIMLIVYSYIELGTYLKMYNRKKCTNINICKFYRFYYGCENNAMQ